MDRGTRLFWAIVISVASASLYFGVRAEQIRRSVQRATATVATGDLLSFKQLIDGDTVLLTNAVGDAVTVRIVGIKSFERESRDVTAKFAQQEVDRLQRTLAGKPVRVMLATPPRDRHGRTLGTLYVDDEDVGESLLREGLVLAYTQFPFPAMSAYLRVQEQARGDRRGLWIDPIAAERARAMAREWQKAAP